MNHLVIQHQSNQLDQKSLNLPAVAENDDFEEDLFAGCHFCFLSCSRLVDLFLSWKFENTVFSNLDLLNLKFELRNECVTDRQL